MMGKGSYPAGGPRFSYANSAENWNKKSKKERKFKHDVTKKVAGSTRNVVGNENA